MSLKVSLCDVPKAKGFSVLIMRQKDGWQRGEIWNLLKRIIYRLIQMDLCISRPPLTPYDFDSDLIGCYNFKLNYSVFHVIVLQEQGCCELVLGLIVSPKASM